MINNSDIDQFTQLIVEFKKEFKKNQKPIEVSFKDIVKDIKANERFTHQIHSYPAKLLLHIPYFFLNNLYFSKKGDIVVDPFNGSGTVALESILADRIFYGADANPLANLISNVKVSSFNIEELKNTAEKIVTKAKFREDFYTPEVRNLHFWFPKNTIDSLSRIYATINEISDKKLKDFFLLSFSNIIKKVSYCDTRISVPVKLNPERYSDEKYKNKITEKIKSINEVNVFDKFFTSCLDNIKRSEELQSTNSELSNFKYLSTDARKLEISKDTPMPENYAQLIITSPPYAGAQKYIRASSLNLGWTKLASLDELNKLERVNIGREIHKKSDWIIKKTGIQQADIVIEEVNKNNPERAYIAYKYIEEMKTSIDEMYRILKNDGYLILIIGNNKITGQEFNTQEYLGEYAINKGMKLEFKLIDDIKSYGLMTKRNKTADIISREYVLALKK